MGTGDAGADGAAGVAGADGVAGSAVEPGAVVLTGSTCAPGLLGGKGAALDRLVGWGLPVPPTGVVTVAAYRALAAAPGPAALLERLRAAGAGDPPVAGDEVDRAFLDAPLPAGLADEVTAVAAEIARRGGTGRLAIRSSATVEDLAHSSFAGQYRSLLDIDGTDATAVLRAVRLVFASLWHPAPCAYRRAFGIDDRAAGGTGGHTVAMAAVLMAMVPARRAGVVFTVDPAGGAGLARLEVVDGLAESLVSGKATPTALLLAREPDRAAAPSPDEPVAGLPETAEVLRLALRVEERAGCPQDVEWAWDGERVWLVQARPITVLAPEGDDEFDDAPEAIEHLDLTTVSIAEMLPGVLPPLLWDIGSYLVEEAFRVVLDGLGTLPDDAAERGWLLHRVRGRAAMDFGRIASLSDALPGAAPDQLEQQYFGSRRPGRPAVPAAPRRHGRWRSVVHDARVLSTRRRAGLDAEVVIAAAAHLAVDGGAVTDVLAPPDDDALLARHLRVLDLATRAMAAELGVAADAAATYRRLELSLSRWVGATDAGRLAERCTRGRGALVVAAPDASAAVVGGPTWQELHREPPAPRRPADTGGDAPDDGANAALEAAAGPSAATWRRRLRLRTAGRLAASAADGLARRERTKAAVLRLGGELRRIHLACGTRLVARGLLEQAGDVDLLTLAELRHAMRYGTAPTPEALARRRRRLRRHGDDGPLPARFRGRPEPVQADIPGDRVEGWAASGGRFTGTAVLVHDPEDPFERDAVLVAEATDPSWSPLFVRAGAIVLERGGPLSHAAILARELGVPAVLNVPGATALAGRRVTVDGDRGVVLLADEDPAPGPVTGCEVSA
jgi:pyruvate,water dikinase